MTAATIAPACRDCNSTQLVEDYNDGSLVCTQCGLVAEPYLLDSRPQFDATRDVNSHISYSQSHSHSPDTAIADILALIDIDSPHIELTATDILNSCPQKSKPAKAYAIYEACRAHQFTRITKELVCAACEINSSSYLKFQSHISKSTNSAHKNHIVADTINTRLIKHATLFIPASKIRMKAIQLASSIEARLKNNEEYAAKKPSKMDLVILYHVCTDMLNIKLKKSDYIKDIDISTTTFNRHIKLIKTILN